MRKPRERRKEKDRRRKGERENKSKGKKKEKEKGKALETLTVVATCTVATMPQKLYCMNDPISMNNFTEIFKRTLIARCYYCPTFQMKPRLRKAQSPGPGSYHQFLSEAEPLFIPVPTHLTLMERKIRRVKRLAFLCTHFKEVRHLIIKTFEVTSSFPP